VADFFTVSSLFYKKKSGTDVFFMV
jgi:hypothetical protein